MPDQKQLVNGADQGIGPLVRGVVDDVQALVNSQFKLLKTEVESDLRKTREALVFLGAGVAVASVGALQLSFMLAFLLHWITLPAGNAGDPGGLPLWACFGLVGALISGAGGYLLYLGWQKFASFNPLPDQTVAALEETLAWKTTTPK